MGNDYTGVAEIRQLEKMINSFCHKTGRNVDEVMTGLLDYIICFLDPTGKPVEGWNFDKEQNADFYEMMKETFCVYAREIPKHGWFDPFGDLYMSLHSHGNYRGQFFTPASLCNITAECACNREEPTGQRTPFGHRIVINDCAAGSGRMPLAGYLSTLKTMQKEWGYDAIEAEAKRPYLSCEDVDANCVKMCAINLAMHGCFGEAICHDTLTEPDSVRFGYIINETMFPFPTNIPSIRREDNPQKFVATRCFSLRAEHKQDKQENVPTIQEKPDKTKENTQNLSKSGEIGECSGNVRGKCGEEKQKEPKQLTFW